MDKTPTTSTVLTYSGTNAVQFGWPRLASNIQRSILYITQQGEYNSEFLQIAQRLQKEFDEILKSFKQSKCRDSLLSSLRIFNEKKVFVQELAVRRDHINYYIERHMYADEFARICPELVSLAFEDICIEDGTSVDRQKLLSCLRSARRAIRVIRRVKYFYHRDLALERYCKLTAELYSRFVVWEIDVTGMVLSAQTSGYDIQAAAELVSLELIAQFLVKPNYLLKNELATDYLERYIEIAEDSSIRIGKRVWAARRAYFEAEKLEQKYLDDGTLSFKISVRGTRLERRLKRNRRKNLPLTRKKRI